jgi:hypothetical protein
VFLVAEKLREFYCGGTKACLMDVLSIRGGSEDLQLALMHKLQKRADMARWQHVLKLRKPSYASKTPAASRES